MYFGRLHDDALEVLERIGQRQRGQRPSAAAGRERHPHVRDEGQEHHQREEAHGRGLPGAGETPALDHGIRQRRVVLEPDPAARDQEEEDGQEHHQRGDDDAHAEDAAVHELHDVEIGLGREQVLDAQDERRGEIGKGPDEDEERARDVARRGERQRHRPELPPAAGAHALRGLLERRVDLAERVDDVERDHGEEVEGLDEHDAVDAVEEVDRLEHVEDVHQQHIDRARPPQDEGEAQRAHERRRDDGDQRQVAEETAPRKS